MRKTRIYHWYMTRYHPEMDCWCDADRLPHHHFKTKKGFPMIRVWY